MDTAPTTIDQSSDFLLFEIDGKRIEIDVYEAIDRLVEVDTKHADDLTTCLDCHAKYAIAPGAEITCPSCGSKKYHPDQSFLDDVAEIVKSYGAARCGRRAAAEIYNAITNAHRELKKNTDSTPTSPGGSESTPPIGADPASAPS